MIAKERVAAMKTIWISLVVVAVCALAVLWLLRSPVTDSDEVGTENAAHVSAVRKTASGGAGGSRPKPVLDLKKSATGSKKADASDVDEDDDDDRTPAERALADRIEKALDEEDLKAALVCAEEAQACRVTEIRQAMVDTLGWFGEKALPELTPFLGDADEDVRESAMNEWMMALSDIEDERQKLVTVELAMSVLKDEDALEEISSEYIGADEKLAVESLVRVIEANRSAEGVAKAKETYEFVTGDEWQDADEAGRWIAEEYEPPDGE